ncbi:hypothetical protein [Formosa algae]|uniref:hypothetical protein n=1 Tax=Formosa algae TaxID=225843 RepID=UPI000CCEE4E6|nr:hypothetical protein [Formosa algae]PNW26329.1 hypothetical protein BKP44_17455 [Formosa algae]
MTTKDIEPVKLFVHGNNISYDVQLSINGIVIGSGNVSSLKICNENHPLKDQVSDLPAMFRDQIAFVLKEGENTISLQFKQKTNNAKPFSFALTSVNEIPPLYYFSSEKTSGSVSSTFYIHNPDKAPCLGNADAAFVFSESISFFHTVINEKPLRAFGGSGGLTDLTLIEGNNILKVNYIASETGEFTYYIKTPNFTKKVVKHITKDQVDKKQIDIYTFEK